MSISQVSLNVDHTRLNYPIVEITKLIVYKGKLYTSIIPGGEIYSFDGSEWRLTYELPKQGKNEFSLWAGGCWEIWEWSKDENLYFGGFSLPQGMFSATIIRFDGSRWKRIDLTEQELLVPQSREEVYGIHEFKGNLYVKTHGGRIYTSSDGLDWRYIRSLDGDLELNAVEAHGMAVFGKELYVPRTGAGIYKFDGTEWSGPICPGGEKHPAHIAAYKGKLYVSFYNVQPTTQIIDRPFISDIEDGFFDVESYHYPNTVYFTSNGNDWFPFASFEEPVKRMESMDGYLWMLSSKRNAQGPGREIHNSLWRYDGTILQRLISLPGVITDITMYRGAYYISNAHNAELQGMRPGTMAFVFSFSPGEIEEYARLKPEPRVLHVWKNKKVGQKGCLTELIPCAGYTTKTIYLISDQQGVLKVLCAPGGDDTKMVFEDDLTVAAGILFKYLVTHGMSWIGFQFTPKAATTVNAYIHLNG